MIRRLRRKFIFTTMSILGVVFALLILGLNLIFARVGLRQTEQFLRQIAQTESMPHSDRAAGLLPAATPAEYGETLSGGEPAEKAAQTTPALPEDVFPEDTTPATPAGRDDSAGPWAMGGDGPNSSFYLNPIFGVRLDENGSVLSVTALTSAAQEDTSARAAQLAADARQKSDSFCKLGGYRCYRVEKPYGSYVVLMDETQSADRYLSGRLLAASVAVGLGALLVLFFVSCLLSRFVTRPAEETFNKQKQFISDASHELKTPLSVISINADVLAGEVGENRHLSYIQSEARRMDGLVHQLLELSRMEDASRPLVKVPFDLSEALYQVALPFESTAFEQDIRYTVQIPDGIRYTGEPESVKQLAAILLDNAFKHTPAHGSICLTLLSGKSPLLRVENTGDGISAEDLPHIFERFYKCDKSRAGTAGSYGLGLAIAKSITQAHNGAIRAESTPAGPTCFTVTL